MDDHNNRRQSPISLEKTWSTMWWPNGVFAFLIAVIEVNTYLAAVHLYGYDKMEQLSFWKLLAKELLFNPYLKEDKKGAATKRKKQQQAANEFRMIPRGMKFSGPHLVQAASDYPQRRCIDCGKKVRTYCKCSPGTHLCNLCYPTHVIEN